MNFSRFDDYAARLDQAKKDMEADDKNAKAIGTLVGRYLSFPSCDGYAYYRVAEIAEGTVYLDHLQIYDGYRDRTIELMDLRVPVTFVEKHLAERERRDAAFAKYRG